MKKITAILINFLIVFALTTAAGAAPVSYTIDGPTSSVELSSNQTEWSWCIFSGSATITGKLNPNLDGISSSLAVGETDSIDFFDLTVTGDGWGAVDTYDIRATLAFSDPPVSAEGSGGGWYGSFAGVINAGSLYWDDTTLPDVLTLSDGTSLSIDFEKGCAIGFGEDNNTATVHAYITNKGAAPVPEPSTVFLLGIGLFALLCFRRKGLRQMQ